MGLNLGWEPVLSLALDVSLEHELTLQVHDYRHLMNQAIGLECYALAANAPEQSMSRLHCAYDRWPEDSPMRTRRTVRDGRDAFLAQAEKVRAEADSLWDEIDSQWSAYLEGRV